MVIAPRFYELKKSRVIKTLRLQLPNNLNTLDFKFIICKLNKFVNRKIK